MPADWNRYGKSAGYRRNEEMHLFIASPSYRKRGCACFWDMRSKGTQHSLGLAKKYCNPIKVYNIIEHKFLTNEEVQLSLQ